MSLSTPDSAPTAPVLPAPEAIRDFVHEAREAYDLDNFNRAISVCERLLAQYPGNAEALLLLGMTSWKMDEPVHAIDMLRRAQMADENTREYADALATVLAHLGDSTESLYYAKLATILTPHPFGDELLPVNFSEYFKNLNYARPHIYRTRAQLALERGAFLEASNLIEKQIDLTPTEPDSLRIAAETFYESNQLARAVTAIGAVIEAGATALDHDRLARSFARAGFFEAALESHETAITLRPDEPAIAQSRLRTLALQYGDGSRSPEYSDACRDWFEKYTPSRTGDTIKFYNPTEPHRRLRIGYLGSAFHARGQAPMFEGILAAHDRDALEIYIYASGSREDLTTQNLMRRCSRWTDVSGIDPETTAHILRNDQIDIAVDLTGHGDGSHLQTFGYAPAPLRLGWLGVKPATYGAYDAELLEAGVAGDAALTVDHPIPTANLPDLLPVAPCATNKHVTFGLIAPVSSLNTATLETVAAILTEVPNSQLLVANHEHHDAETMARIQENLSAHGLVDRVTVAELEDSRAQRVEFFRYIDILIDPQPVSGFTETAEALWFGVPVLTTEQTRAARAIHAAEHPEWVFTDKAALVTAACALARDVGRLVDLRKGLRSEIAACPLYNWLAFTKQLEAAYRSQWVAKYANQSNPET